MTLRVAGDAAAPTAAAPAAAPAAAAIAVRRLRVLAAFLAPLRRAAVLAPPFFPAAERADEAFELLDAGRFEALPADFFAPPFRAAEAFRGEAFFEERFFEEAFFEEAFFEEAFLEAAFFEELFFDDGRALLEAFLEDFRDEPFFDALFFEDLREEPFFDAAMLCLLLKLSVPGPDWIRDHAAWQLGCTKSI